jgi:hypothetical protein
LADAATATITGSADPTADIPYLIMGDDVYRVQATPATNLTCYIQSKDFDMSDQQPAFQNVTKTVDHVQLEYVDEDSSTPVAVSLSVNGGQTWVGTTSRAIGTGSGLTRVADFWFLPVTGKMFRIKVESTSSSKNFCWTGVYISYSVGGPYIEIV